jgi:hypothetical protein
MDVVLQKFCQGCDICHENTVWYHRQNQHTRVWLCGIRYLLLGSEDKQVWKIGTWDMEPSDGNSSRGPISIAKENYHR